MKRETRVYSFALMRGQAKNSRISQCHLFWDKLTEENAKIAYRSAWKNIPRLFWDRKRRSSHFPSRVTRRVHRARRSYKITFPSRTPCIIPRSFSFFPSRRRFLALLNKEREERLPRRDISCSSNTQQIPVNALWKSGEDGNPGVRLRNGGWRIGRQLSESWGALNTSILTCILFRSLLCRAFSFTLNYTFILDVNTVNDGIRVFTSFFLFFVFF